MIFSVEGYFDFVADQIFEMIAEELSWSVERPCPEKFKDVSPDNLFLLNVFICHKSIAKKLAGFYNKNKSVL
jgi:hypothetical protein